MENRRFHFMNRHQDRAMPRFPFKDCIAVTIKVNRRKIPNRRLDDFNLD